jgi:hypothetical protein
VWLRGQGELAGAAGERVEQVAALGKLPAPQAFGRRHRSLL